MARVGGETISPETVRRIAAAQRVSLEEARARAVRDALFAEEARARGVEEDRLEATFLARALLDDLRRETAGPIRDDELERTTERHFPDLRRPEGVRTIHALVRPTGLRKEATEDQRARADAVAAALRDAVAGASELAREQPRADEDPAVAEFQRLVRTVPAGDLEVKVETLPPITRDGRVLQRRGGSFVAEYAAAVWPLRGRGDLTVPFRSPFGTHVAMVLERTPAREVPADERRRLLADEILDDRIRARRLAILEGGASRVELPPNAPALLDLVHVQ